MSRVGAVRWWTREGCRSFSVLAAFKCLSSARRRVLSSFAASPTYIARKLAHALRPSRSTRARDSLGLLLPRTTLSPRPNTPRACHLARKHRTPPICTSRRRCVTTLPFLEDCQLGKPVFYLSRTGTAEPTNNAVLLTIRDPFSSLLDRGIVQQLPFLADADQTLTVAF